ncbi:MAG: hypothetical protein HY701_07170, partial [Gemmatimonadetes bacterium]|nr:hypothetical protein [Gemmatimonadota bacterium]
RPYLVERVEYEAAAVEKHWRDARGVSEQLGQLADRLAQGPWTGAALEERLRKLAADRSIPAARLIHPLRVALTGQAVSPGIFEVLVVLGRERSLRRVGEAVRYLRDRSAAGAGVRDR